MPPLMLPAEVRSLLVAFLPCLTAPSFAYFQQFVWVMMAGWGRCCTTTVCRNDAAAKHHTNYARFLGAYRWTPQQVAQGLLELLRQRLPAAALGARLTVAIDDRPIAKSRGKMPGLGWHHCHNRGACAGPFVHGHVWLHLALVAWRGGQACSLPLRALLYRPRKQCRADQPYQAKWRLALEGLQGLCWPHPVRVVADGSFYVRAFVQELLAAEHDLICRMPKVAAVHELPPARAGRGRPRRYGPQTSLATAAQRAGFAPLPERLWGWRGPLPIASCTLVPTVVRRPCTVVCVRVGDREPRYLLCTDLALPAAAVVRLYAARFSIELTFRELTQRCGCGDYQVRKARAIEAHVQLAQVACSLLYLLSFDPALPIEQFVWPAWRQPSDHLSLGQTQQLLRQLAFSAQQPAHTGAPKSRAAQPAAA